MSNCWVEFLKYMSAKEIGDTLTRNDLRTALAGWPDSTVSQDISLSKKKNFIKSIGYAKYEVIRRFPKYVTLAEFFSIPTDNLDYLEYVLNKKEQRL